MTLIYALFFGWNFMLASNAVTLCYWWFKFAGIDWHIRQTIAICWIQWLRITTNYSWSRGLYWWVLKRSLEHSRKIRQILASLMTQKRILKPGRYLFTMRMKLAETYTPSMPQFLCNPCDVEKKKTGEMRGWLVCVVNCDVSYSQNLINSLHGCTCLKVKLKWPLIVYVGH